MGLHLILDMDAHSIVIIVVIVVSIIVINSIDYEKL